MRRATAYIPVRRLSWSISISILLQFTTEVRAAAENCRKITKTPILGFKVVQDH